MTINLFIKRQMQLGNHKNKNFSLTCNTHRGGFLSHQFCAYQDDNHLFIQWGQFVRTVRGLYF